MNRNIFWSILRIVGVLVALIVAYLFVSGMANMTFQPDRYSPPRTLEQIIFGN